MSEPATTTPAPPVDRAALIEEAWAAAEADPVVVDTIGPGEDAPPPPAKSESLPTRQEASAPAEPPKEAPLTKEDLAEKPRESAAPSIREFLRSQKPKSDPTGLEKEVIELRAALDQIRQAGKEPEAPLSESEQVLAELKRLQTVEAERVAQAQEEAAQAAYQERIRVLRESAAANLQAHKDDYPALFALKQEDTVVNELFARLDNDMDASEEEIAGEVEEGLWKVYEALHAIKQANGSEEKSVKSESPTISNALAGLDEEEDVEGLTREQLIDRAWAKANS